MTTTDLAIQIETALDVARRVISDGQSPDGAYVASPAFAEYAFGWLRDGSFIALAMDALNDHESSARFHGWARDVVLRNRNAITAVVRAHREGRRPRSEDLLPTRYTLDGEREPAQGDAWPNFQIDGYGTWLHALHAHGADIDDGTREAIVLVAEYLVATAEMPCFDYWEEYGDRQHTSTLASVAAGLRAAALMTGESRFAESAHAVIRRIRTECVHGGAFVKGPEDTRVDASLLSLSTPFDIVAVDDPYMLRTIERMRHEILAPSGGVRRYVGDTYYGGNPWILLTAWWGWHARRRGDVATYEAARDWVLGAADGRTGALAEQTLDEPQRGAEAYVGIWTERWGPVADPLLWSHAMFALMERGSR